MNVEKGIWQEVWKPITFDFEYTNENRIEVSNFGRVRTFNKISDGRILNGSITEGYKVIKLKLYKPRPADIQAEFDKMKNELSELYKKRRQQITNKVNPFTIQETSVAIEFAKDRLSNRFKSDLKNRTINHHFLVHRMVATLFLPKPKSNETIVGHLDYDKLNNRVSNLKWMTPEENQLHQSKSPFVIAEKKQRKQTASTRKNASKLTVTKVMLLKKLLQEGKPMKQLVKKFKVSHTQILRFISRLASTYY